MNPCFAYNSSLKFARSFFGIAALLAFFLQSKVLVFVLGITMVMGAISLKYNPVYQFHFLILRKFLKNKDEAIAKDSGELSFACAMGSFFLLIPSLLFFLNKYLSLAWTLVLLDAILMLLAGIAGTCVASILYAVLIKKWFVKKKA